MGRNRQLKFVKEHLVPLLKTEFNHVSSRTPDESHRAQVEDILAEAILEEGKGFFKQLLKVLVPLAVIDLLLPMAPQVYGLVISMVGTWILLVYSDILSTSEITRRSENSTGATLGGRRHLDITEARRLAKNTATTNVGLVWMTLGFLFQIVAVTIFSSSDVLTMNLLDTL